MLYHVSATPGIKVLEPRVSTHGKAYVYAIENLITGLLFGAPKDDFDFLISTNESGFPTCFECYPGAFELKYKGRSCSIYELAEDGFLRGMTSWSPELVCETAVPVQKETFVPDLYERLLEEEKQGNLCIRQFENSAEYKQFIAGFIVKRLIQGDTLKYAATDKRFQTYYKGIVDALQSAMDGHLLNPYPVP